MQIVQNFLYVLVGGVTDSKDVESTLQAALAKKDPDLRVWMKASVVLNNKWKDLNYAYVWVPDTTAWNILCGRNPNGTEKKVELIHPVQDEEEAKKFPDYLNWLAQKEDLDQKYENGGDWADYEDELDQLNANFSKGKEKKTSDLEIPYKRCGALEMDPSRSYADALCISTPKGTTVPSWINKDLIVKFMCQILDGSGDTLPGAESAGGEGASFSVKLERGTWTIRFGRGSTLAFGLSMIFYKSCIENPKKKGEKFEFFLSSKAKPKNRAA